jgi:hypothetical protein
MPNCHIRGEFLTITCEALLESGAATHTVKLIHWKTRRLLLSVSSMAVFRSMALQLITAYYAA